MRCVQYLKDGVDALEDILGAERGRLRVQQSIVEERKEVFAVLVPAILGYEGYRTPAHHTQDPGNFEAHDRANIKESKLSVARIRCTRDDKTILLSDVVIYHTQPTNHSNYRGRKQPL